eukprot:CAMPEP_0197515114 /NCGR_PEP_ID=MMETSP1318-20131121/340_1 /TAXON_ID=552666 /ORGANISM="Partenskyella glossopodia, Strain RCC365" /LENGTH=460 /DNA_ID=CAMNT_0043063393 /DNA_START=30 /DNA_END=1412 /DNA_ORIENTATION=-
MNVANQGTKNEKKSTTAEAKKSYNSWLSRVYSNQKSKITPELRAKMKKKAERTVRITKNRRKCNKLRLVSKKANKAWYSGYQNVKMAREQKLDKVAYQRSYQSKVQEMNQLQRELSAEEDEAAMARYDNIATEEREQEVDDSEIAGILKELRNEPKNDEETKAKFALYETFLETVEQIRKETFTFWGEAKQDFEGNSKLSVERKLKGIDSADNMAIDFDGPLWFVHGMTKQAIKNRTTITNILQWINDKLELLGNQETCPICLDPFVPGAVNMQTILEEAKLGDYKQKFLEAKIDAAVMMKAKESDVDFWKDIQERTGLKPGHLLRLKRTVASLKDREKPKEVHTLVCCHKVCKECWDNYSATGDGGKCPLCRTEDFLEYIAQQHSQLGGGQAVQPPNNPVPPPEPTVLPTICIGPPPQPCPHPPAPTVVPVPQARTEIRKPRSHGLLSRALRKRQEQKE